MGIFYQKSLNFIYLLILSFPKIALAEAKKLYRMQKSSST